MADWSGLWRDRKRGSKTKARAASKAAIISATKVLARELGGYNIRVNAIAPGLTNTDMMANSTEENALDVTMERLIIKRVATPAEIGNVVIFLASSLSSYITGQTIRVDGGITKSI